MDELRLRFDKKFAWGQNKPILFAERLYSNVLDI